jgi:trigger factor
LTDLQISLESASGLERRLRIQVPAFRIETELENRLRNAGKTLNLKGFRKGKIPPHVVRQRFGAQIRQEVLQDVVQSTYSEAVARENLRPAGNPRIEAGAAENGEDFIFTAIVEVYPEFKVTGVESLVVDKPEVGITDADIERTVERLRWQKGSWVAAGRPAARGDRLTIDFDGRLNGQPIDGGKAEKVELVLGEGRMLADFEAALEGMAAGETRQFPLRFPDDYHEQTLRGQTAQFEAHVHAVETRQLPALDGDFIRGLGIESGDEAEFRRLVRENLEREAAAKVQADMRRQLMEQLLASNPVDLPSVLVEREAAGLQAEGMRNMGIRDVADAPALDAYRSVAERRVRLGLIIGALIREQDLKLDTLRVDNRLDELCRQYQRPGDVKQAYQQNRDLMIQIENSVMEEQVMSWLMERARIETSARPLAELMGS